jgi:hypothetical protein
MDRDAQARQVLLEELARTRERLLGLEQDQRALRAAVPAADPVREAALAQALARTRRDLQSLQRELDRRAPGGPR